jgi:hypothetical protein
MPPVVPPNFLRVVAQGLMNKWPKANARVLLERRTGAQRLYTESFRHGDCEIARTLALTFIGRRHGRDFLVLIHVPEMDAWRRDPIGRFLLDAEDEDFTTRREVEEIVALR